MRSDSDVLVIGAGISGLTAAYELQRRGLRVLVVEAAERAGGVIATVRENGFLYERGPNSILDTSPRIGALLDALGIRGERVEMHAAAARRYVLKHGRLVALPMSPPAFLATPLFSLRGKLQLLREPFVAAAHGEESIADFVRRRLGSEFLDYAVEPFVAGIYAGNPDELSVQAAFPRLYALEQAYGSLIKGQIGGTRERKARGEPAKNIAKSFSFREGVQTLTDALAARVEVHTAHRAAALHAAGGEGIRVDIQSRNGGLEVHARAVVAAVPASAAGDLVLPLAPDAAVALNEIPYAPVASVARAYRREQISHPLDGFGFLAPRVERRRILGCLFSSSTFEARAPAGHVLLTTFVGGQRNPDLARGTTDEIDRTVSDELSVLLGASGPAELSVVTQWPRAIPQYTMGHLERLRRAAAAEEAMRGLFLSGAYRGGVAVGDCIASAYKTAERVEAYFRS
ncbi:MAG TPA: protoporphyrinogen oxidase [Burkholderiales bacterium]|nr:protoporphyrinogen oxidase [Burkholderiales bacterium]